MLARFQEAVRHHPNRTAVRDAERVLTFAELDRWSGQLAAALRGRGIGRGDRVGLCLPRGASLVVSLLAVWRAGGAYVPLDPSYPDDRLAFMAEDAGIIVLVADGEPDWLPTGTDTISAAATPPGPFGPWTDVRPADLDTAYVIYTSGTTGTPKGVQATRAGVASLVAALEQRGYYAPEPRVVAWNASMSFDASVQQWVRVCRGDTLVVFDEAQRRDPARLVAWLRECAVDDLDLTPSHWELLREHLPVSSTRGRALRLFIGGEPISARAWAELANAGASHGIEALNLYGPTECTVNATATWIRGPGTHIGTPLPGLLAHVLDDALRPVPCGATGELYLAGSQLALGYLNRPGLTAERFVADPFGRPETRMYRTGDRVRRTSGAELEFVGRVDRQVKIRGHRVELDEVESVLRAHPDVAAAAVVARDGRLVAYHVPVVGAEPAADVLRRAAAEMLPDFMVPAAFVAIERMPINPNGKLDAEALPDPDVTVGEEGPDPAGRFEELVAGIWSEVLGRDRIRTTDDFFALGGHSLTALRVVARLRKCLGLSMSSTALHRYPLLADLARHVESWHQDANDD